MTTSLDNYKLNIYQTIIHGATNALETEIVQHDNLVSVSIWGIPNCLIKIDNQEIRLNAFGTFEYKPPSVFWTSSGYQIKSIKIPASTYVQLLDANSAMIIEYQYLAL